MDETEYWQDAHIKKHDDGQFMCFDECGEFLIMTDTIKQAREYLEYYDMYVLNNLSD